MVAGLAQGTETPIRAHDVRVLGGDMGDAAGFRKGLDAEIGLHPLHADDHLDLIEVAPRGDFRGIDVDIARDAV